MSPCPYWTEELWVNRLSSHGMEMFILICKSTLTLYKLECISHGINSSAFDIICYNIIQNSNPHNINNNIRQDCIVFHHDKMNTCTCEIICLNMTPKYIWTLFWYFAAGTESNVQCRCKGSHVTDQHDITPDTASEEVEHRSVVNKVYHSMNKLKTYRCSDDWTH